MRRGKRETWLKKYERLRGLEALLETYYTIPNPDRNEIKRLKERILRTRAQLKVMSDVGNKDVGLHGRTQ